MGPAALSKPAFARVVPTKKRAAGAYAAAGWAFVHRRTFVDTIGGGAIAIAEFIVMPPLSFVGPPQYSPLLNAFDADAAVPFFSKSISRVAQQAVHNNMRPSTRVYWTWVRHKNISY